jgi:DNA-binding NarL/FixJ family response regulator
MNTLKTGTFSAVRSIPIHVVIADDHAIVRQGLRTLLERTFCIVGEAADGLEALRLVERECPEVLIVDMMMPHLNGLEVIRQVHRRFTATRIIVMSMLADEANVAQAILDGASAYVLKQASGMDLFDAIYAVNNGDHFFSLPLSAERINEYVRTAQGTDPDPFEALTTREREIFQLVAEGNTSQQIGQLLFISPRTAEVHRSNLMRKLNLSSKAELIRYAMTHGLIT